MRKIRLFSVFALLVLLMSVGSGVGMAQESPPGGSPSPSLPGPDIPVSEWTDADLQRFVDLAFNERISVRQTQTVWEQLSKEQRDKVGELIAAKASGPPNEERQLVERKMPAAHRLSETTPTSNGFLWGPYPIENAWTVGYPPGYAFPSWWYVNASACDNDPADAEYIFVYYMDYSQNPDGLRWTSDSAWVYLVLMSAYGGNLNSFAYAWDEVRLCIGDGAMEQIGEPDDVVANVFLHPNN